MLSTGWITIQRITWFVLLTLIHWIAIYPVDGVLHLSKNPSWVFFNNVAAPYGILKHAIVESFVSQN